MQLIAIDRDQPQLSYPTTGALVISATTTGPFAVLSVGNQSGVLLTQASEDSAVCASYPETR
jgi:hypothetical protein